jgi:hypothetical protein
VATFGTAYTATGVTFHLSNPARSKVNLAVLQSQVTILTGGTGGHLSYVANVNPAAAAVVHGTPLVVYNSLLGGANGIGCADAAATLPAVPVAVRALACVITAAGTNSIIDYVDGALVVAPGCALSIQGLTVVGTGLISMCWAEIPIL